MKRVLLIAAIAAVLPACRLGKGMDMPPAKPYVIAPDRRPPSEVDPALHISLPDTAPQAPRPDSPMGQPPPGRG